MTPARPRRSLVSLARDLDSDSFGAEAERFIGWTARVITSRGGELIRDPVSWRAWLGGAIVIIVCIGIGGVVAVVVSLIFCTDEE